MTIDLDERAVAWRIRNLTEDYEFHTHQAREYLFMWETEPSASIRAEQVAVAHVHAAIAHGMAVLMAAEIGTPG